MKKEQNFFIKQFKKILYERGFTQQEFAEKLGVDQVMISQWMNAARNPSIKSIRKIAEVLEVPLNYFIETSEKKDIDNNDVKEMKTKMSFMEEKLKRYDIEINYLKDKINIFEKMLMKLS